MESKGTLTHLEQLKAEYREKFKAEAPKVKQIDLMCFRLRCSTVMNPRNIKFTHRGLRLAKQTCTRKNCPRNRFYAALAKYREMLDRTRPFRQQNDDAHSRAFWWGIVEKWKAKLQSALHMEEA